MKMYLCYLTQMKKFILLGLAILFLSGLFPTPALAGRYVLNQTPATIQRHFGRPWTIETLKDKPNTKLYTYSPSGVRRVFPTFPKQGKFGMTFVDNRVQTIWLIPNTANNGYFNYNTKQFFNYIFGYEPPIWKDLQYPGGHEGFADYRGCLGDGVVATYIDYLLGSDNITLAYNSICEPPYDRIPKPSV